MSCLPIDDRNTGLETLRLEVIMSDKKSLISLFVGMLCISLVAACEPEPIAEVASPVERDWGPKCDSVDACISILRTYKVNPSVQDDDDRNSGVVLNDIGNATDFLASQGSDAMGALVPFLDDPHYKIRKRIGYAIHSIQDIDSEYVEVLISAHRSGVSWLELPIARTGTDKALDFLWLEFLYEPSESAGIQSIMGLAQFGDRAFVHIEPAISRCNFHPEARICYGLVELAEYFETFPVNAVPLFEQLATDPSLDEYQKLIVASNLARLQANMASNDIDD